MEKYIDENTFVRCQSSVGYQMLYVVGKGRDLGQKQPEHEMSHEVIQSCHKFIRT